MPFVEAPRPCITIECDACGTEFDNGDGHIPHYPNIESAKADLAWQSDSGWIVIEGSDRVWCEPCGAPECVCGHVFAAHDAMHLACEPDVWEAETDENGSVVWSTIPKCWCQHYTPYDELVLRCQEQRWHCYVCGDADVPADEMGYDYDRGVPRCFVCRAAGEHKPLEKS